MYLPCRNHLKFSRPGTLNFGSDKISSGASLLLSISSATLFVWVLRFCRDVIIFMFILSYSWCNLNLQ